jgi:hypothetical protein
MWVPLFALSACGPSETLVYRVTVEVDAPEGLRSGSSIWEVKTSSGLAFPGPEAASRSNNIIGEAVTIDLASGTLFALMRSAGGSDDYPANIVQMHLEAHPELGVAIDSSNWAENIRRINQSGVMFDLAAHRYPMLVRFTNSRAPLSVEKVEPESLGKAFPGARIRRVVVSVIGNKERDAGYKRVRIGERLPWLNSIDGNYIDGGRTNKRAPYGLHGGHFERATS